MSKRILHSIFFCMLLLPSAANAKDSWEPVKSGWQTIQENKFGKLGCVEVGHGYQTGIRFSYSTIENNCDHYVRIAYCTRSGTQYVHSCKKYDYLPAQKLRSRSKHFIPNYHSRDRHRVVLFACKPPGMLKEFYPRRFIRGIKASGILMYIPPTRPEMKAAAQHKAYSYANGVCQYKKITDLPTHPDFIDIVLNKVRYRPNSAKRTFSTSGWAALRNGEFQNFSMSADITLIVNPKGRVSACYINQANQSELHGFFKTEVCVQAYRLRFSPALDKTGNPTWGYKKQVVRI